MLVIGYKQCNSCNGVEKELKEKGIDYNYREIDKASPSAQEIKEWHSVSGLDIKKFFNTSGKSYREMNLKDKLEDMSIEEKYKLLGKDPMLVKRPIIIEGNDIYVGPDAKKYVAGL